MSSMFPRTLFGEKLVRSARVQSAASIFIAPRNAGGGCSFFFFPLPRQGPEMRRLAASRALHFVCVRPRSAEMQASGDGTSRGSGCAAEATDGGGGH